MTTLADAAYFSPPYPQVDGWLVYLGGDTPNPVPVAAMAALPGGYRVPVWVRSNPGGANMAFADAQAFLALLAQNGAPKGTVVVLDLETAVDAAYVNAFGSLMHAGGYFVWVYGSKDTIFQNPMLDGYFVADPTGVDHIVAGSVATQYLWAGKYDLEDIASSGLLWNTKAPSPHKLPKGIVLVNKPPVAILSCVTGGYWIVCADGGVFNFGGAPFFGSLGNVQLNAPIVSASATPSGKGYFMVGADGGVFNFGDATYAGRVQVA